MIWQIFRSYMMLVRIEFLMRFCTLARLHRLVRDCPVHETSDATPSADWLCHCVDLACVFYVKPVLCLQRSAATTLILRSYGWKAEMVIGAQLFPFKSHAWVEIDHAVVNDKPYMTEIYRVLERC